MYIYIHAHIYIYINSDQPPSADHGTDDLYHHLQHTPEDRLQIGALEAIDLTVDENAVDVKSAMEIMMRQADGIMTGEGQQQVAQQQAHAQPKLQAQQQAQIQAQIHAQCVQQQVAQQQEMIQQQAAQQAARQQVAIQQHAQQQAQQQQAIQAGTQIQAQLHAQHVQQQVVQQQEMIQQPQPVQQKTARSVLRSLSKNELAELALDLYERLLATTGMLAEADDKVNREHWAYGDICYEEMEQAKKIEEHIHNMEADNLAALAAKWRDRQQDVDALSLAVVTGQTKVKAATLSAGSMFKTTITRQRRCSGLVSLSKDTLRLISGFLACRWRINYVFGIDGGDSDSDHFDESDAEDEDPFIRLDACFSPDGKTIASISGLCRRGRGTSFGLWSGTTGALTLTHECFLNELQGASYCHCCCLAPDGSAIMIGGSKGELELFDTKTGQLQHAASVDSSIEMCCFSPDGTVVLVIADHGKKLEIRDAQLCHLKTLYSPTILSCCCLSPDGNSIMSASKDGELKLYDARTGEPQQRNFDMAEIENCGFSPDGKVVLVNRDTSRRNKIELRNAQTLLLFKTLEVGVGVGPLKSFCFSPTDRSALVTGHSCGSIKLWDFRTGCYQELPKTLCYKDSMMQACVASGVRKCCFSPDGKSIVCTSGPRMFLIGCSI
jgi:hypothetical protein